MKHLAPGIVSDPKRKGGDPIVDVVGIPTEDIYETYRSGCGDIEAVADFWEIKNKHVLQAVQYEESRLYRMVTINPYIDILCLPLPVTKDFLDTRLKIEYIRNELDWEIEGGLFPVYFE